MKNTLTCDCERWIWHHDGLMWEDQRTGDWSSLAVTCQTCDESLERNPECEAEPADTSNDPFEYMREMGRVWARLPKCRIETDNESRTLTFYEDDGVTVSATLTMRDGGVIEYEQREG